MTQSPKPHTVPARSHCQATLKREFHVRREVRDRYDFDDEFFSIVGTVVFGSLHEAHVFAEKFNSDRPDHLQLQPEELNAGALIHEALHAALNEYREDVEPELFQNAYRELVQKHGRQDVDQLLLSFSNIFPTRDAYRNKIPATRFLNETTDGTSNRQLALEEVLLCRLTNENPAYAELKELVHDGELRSSKLYDDFVSTLDDPPGPASARSERRRLIEMLRAPALHAPNSLRDQLDFIRKNWAGRFSESFSKKLATGSDFMTEAERLRALRAAPPGPPPPPPVPKFDAEPEVERFSPDTDWMPNVVMIAKNALVWLDQLSTRYERTLNHLDDIPDEELKQLAGWGFNAVWLIGVWQRSRASKELKRRTGNPEAEASAYALYDYEIAEELGGEGSLAKLRERAGRFGIRLASDMVPNHTGIDGKWVREHPDWFIQLPRPPYPGYKYTSDPLARVNGKEIRVEDGYYDRTDAAVTFELKDVASGRVRYLYHGNDGTSMPWNDTAQLDFLKAEVRDAVTKTIIDVARRFPIIRFDAAMVLARRHVRRLWYPEPGSGGGIPSRLEHGLNRADFEKLMPKEFWREVVDRVAEEVPDTLLLAEAFWLMEGYFVRTLGMHRVYNSAFMHMLKDEKTGDYREVMTNTLNFDPEILKRHVNFMSNPDEETAIHQFGDGDKFFGVSLVLATMPGLPMFAHGQIEGLTEKYGMEYKRAYRDEQPRADLIERLEKEIFPLLRKRHIFSEVRHFRLFNFLRPSGSVNSNVLCYTNRLGSEGALIVFNNRLRRTEGTVRRTIVYGENAPDELLAESLGISESGAWLTFREHVSGLEYVRPLAPFREEGFQLSMDGYAYKAFLDFTVHPDDQLWQEVWSRLGSRGTSSLDDLRFDIETEELSDEIAVLLTDEEQESTEKSSLLPRDLRDDLLSVLQFWNQVETDTSAEGKQESAARTAAAAAWLDDSVRAGVLAERLLNLEEELALERRGRLSRQALVKADIAPETEVEDIIDLVRSIRQIESDEDRFALTATKHWLRVHEFENVSYFNRERFDVLNDLLLCLDAGKDLPEAHARYIVRAKAAGSFEWDRLQSNLNESVSESSQSDQTSSTDRASTE